MLKFYFSRPHKPFRRVVFTAAGFPTEQLLTHGLKAVPYIAIAMAVAGARSVEVRHSWPRNTPVTLSGRRYLDCYRNRCDLREFRSDQEIYF
jgi:hypothetical protein